jgi:hypothetical protein
VYFLESAHGAGACDHDCTLLWPAVPSDRMPLSQTGLLGELRRDGILQATYAGRALYYFAEDLSAGDVYGNRFQEFGQMGYLVTASGHEVGGKVAANASEWDDDNCGCADRPDADARFAIAFVSNDDATHRWLSRLLTGRAAALGRLSVALR